MTIPDLNHWSPITHPQVRNLMNEFTDWFLCGGTSIDLFVGRTTRSHADIDIGVYRSDILRCLNSLDKDSVYVCDPPGTLVAWQGEEIEHHVTDIWLRSADRSCWILQIMLYTDAGDTVFFKRDASVTWSKSAHTIECEGYRILNPAITMLFKASRGGFEKKDAQDIATLIEFAATNSER